MRYVGVIIAIIAVSSSVFGSNRLGVFAQSKWLDKVILPMVGVQYERYLLPMTSAYIRYSVASLDYSPSSDYHTKSEYSNTSVGFRADLLFVTLGVGYESLSADFSDNSASVSAKVDGIVFEAGKCMTIGPLQAALFYRVQFADVLTTVDHDGEISIPVSEGAQTVHAIDISASIFF